MRDPRYAPALRADLRFVLQPNQLVRVYEPTYHRYIELHPVDCHIAQLMNGQRNMDELAELARQFNPQMMRDALERMVVDLSGHGLLDGAIVAPHPVAHADDDDSAGTDFDSTALEPEIADPAPVNLHVVPPVPAPAEEPAEEPEAPDEPEPAAEEPDVAAQEQEALWNEAHQRKWHQRTWLRVLGVLALVTGVAAVVPYPLRVTSECTLIPSERAKVRSELQGVITEIMVDEGQVVKKGDVIARLDDRALKADRQKKLAEIEKLEAQLATLRQGHRPEEIQQQMAVLAARRNEAAFAQKEAKRRGQMAKEGVGSVQNAEQANRELGTKIRAVAEAEAALRLLQAGSRPEEIAAQEAVLKGARAELGFIDERLAMSVIKAPIAGAILTPRFREHVNEGVDAGGLICEIANTSTMRAEILVPERDIDVIEIGMPATVKVESYPTRPFEGKVNFIAPTVEGEGKRVRVVVQLDNAEGLLKADMSGYGEVEAGKRSLLALATRRVIRWFRVRFLI